MDTSPEATAVRLRRVYACGTNDDVCKVYGVRKWDAAAWHREMDERALARQWLAEHQEPAPQRRSEAITATCRDILANLDRWQAEAWQQAQQEQDTEAYADTMLGHLEAAVGRLVAQAVEAEIPT